jgi:hypothetical protein
MPAETVEPLLWAWGQIIPKIIKQLNYVQILHTFSPLHVTKAAGP